MSIKKGIFIVLVLGILILGFFLFIKAGTPFKKNTNSIYNLRVGNIGEFSIFDLVAKEKGYFKQNGLNVQIVNFESGPAAVKDLLDGKVDIAVAADFVGVSNIFTNNNLRIISQASRHKVWQIVGRKDKGIQKISDLKGKRIGVTRKGAGEFYLSQFLNFNNLNVKDITLIDLSPTEMINQLKSGQIDAAVIFDPHAYNLVNQLRTNSISWSVQGDRETFALVYTTEQFIKAHPDVVVRYIQSLIQAEQYFNSSPQVAEDFIVNTLHYDRKYVSYMWPNFTFTQTLDQELLLAMEDQARFVIKNNLTAPKTVPNYLNYIYFSALEKIDLERITIIH